MAHELLRRKMALIQAVEAEETARKVLLEGLRGLLKEVQASGGSDKALLESCNELMVDLLKKKKGAQHYEEQLYIVCEKIRDAIGSYSSKKAEPAKTTGAPPPANSSQARTPSPSTVAAGKSPVPDKESLKSIPPGNNSTPQQVKPSTGETSSTAIGTSSPTITSTGKKRLTPVGISLFKFHKLIELLRENEGADDEENLIVLLTRLKELKRVTIESVKETGAGKVISKLSKHRLREVKDLAAKTMANWKTVMANATKQAKASVPPPKPKPMSKERYDEKLQRSAQLMERRQQEAKNGSKTTKSYSSSGPAVKKLPSSAGKGDKRERPVSNVGKPKLKPSKSREAQGSSKASKLSDYDAWVQQRERELQAQGEFVEKEEEFSRQIADDEDELARLEELNAKRRKRGMA